MRRLSVLLVSAVMALSLIATAPPSARRARRAYPSRPTAAFTSSFLGGWDRRYEGMMPVGELQRMCRRSIHRSA
jgi:hypothetical protein